MEGTGLDTDQSRDMDPATELTLDTAENDGETAKSLLKLIIMFDRHG